MLKELIEMINITKRQLDTAGDEFNDGESNEEFYLSGKLDALEEILGIFNKEKGANNDY